MPGAKKWNGAFTLMYLGLVVAPVFGQQPSPGSVVFHNGKVLTVDDRFSVAEAVAVRDGKITAVGSNDDVLKSAGPDALRVDLKGKSVIPGLIDTHTHVMTMAERNYGGSLGSAKLTVYPINWKLVKTKDDVLKQVKDVMNAFKFKPGEWVYFSSTFLNDPKNVLMLNMELTRWDLDKVTPDNPIVLNLGIPRENGYLVNSRAIDIIWNKYGDFINRYGRYWRDPSGKPDGHLEPPASRLINQYMPEPEPEDLAEAYRKQLDEFIAMGVTTVSTRLDDYSIEVYKLLESRDDMPLRIAYGFETTFGVPDRDMKDLKLGGGSDKVWLVSVTPAAVDGAGARQCTELKRDYKAAADEEQGVMGIALLGPYYPKGQCHLDIEYPGGPTGRGAPLRGNYFREWLDDVADEGLRFANTHVSGDGSHGRLLTALEQINSRNPGSVKGWAFDHCSLVNPADIPRAAKLGVVFSCYPGIDSAQRVAQVFGEKVAHTFVTPVKSMVDAGIHVAFEMDRDNYIWSDLELLVTREDNNGKVWGPKERVDRATMLKMVTRWAAEYVLKGGTLGTIETGKTADLAILDRDFMAIADKEISDIQPMMTMLGGEIVYLRSDFAKEHGLRPEGAVISTHKELVGRRNVWLGGARGM